MTKLCFTIVLLFGVLGMQVISLSYATFSISPSSATFSISPSPAKVGSPTPCERIQKLVAPCNEFFSSQGKKPASASCCSGFNEMLAITPTKAELKNLCSCNPDPSLPEKAINAPVLEKLAVQCNTKFAMVFSTWINSCDH